MAGICACVCKEEVVGDLQRLESLWAVMLELLLALANRLQQARWCVSRIDSEAAPLVCKCSRLVNYDTMLYLFVVY